MLNGAQFKTLAVFSVFAIIGFGPVSPGCLIGLFITLFRPVWFLNLVLALYEQTATSAQPSTISDHPRIKAFASLLALFIIDILPIPVTPVIAIFIILLRPRWFLDIVLNVYA